MGEFREAQQRSALVFKVNSPDASAVCSTSPGVVARWAGGPAVSRGYLK
jgi:hypothetical protein